MFEDRTTPLLAFKLFDGFDTLAKRAVINDDLEPRFVDVVAEVRHPLGAIRWGHP